MNRQITTFAVALTALVLPTAAVAVAQGADVAHLDAAPIPAQIALYGQAFLPSVAALIATRRIDWGFRRVPVRTLLVAWLIPVLCVAAGYGTAWVTGLAEFVPGSPVGALLGGLLGVAPFLILALGEQLGWSSFLTVRLAASRGPDATALIVGLAWAAFHYPLMLFVPGSVAPGVPVAYAMGLFTVETVALAFPLVWLRLRTRSVWPVLLMHAGFNAAVYFAAQPMTGRDPGHLLGEGGPLTSAATALVVLATMPLWRRSLTARRRKTMGNTTTMRGLAGGLVGSGGVLFALGNALHPLEHTHEAHSAPTWEAAHLIFALGGLLIAAGLPLLLAVGNALRPSRLALTGGVILAIGFAGLTPGAWFEAFVAPLPGEVAEQIEAGAGGSLNALAGLVWMASLVAFGAGLAWRGARRSVRLAGVALLAAAVVTIVGPGLGVAEGLFIIPATVVTGVALLTVAVAGTRTRYEGQPAVAQTRPEDVTITAS